MNVVGLHGVDTALDTGAGVMGALGGARGVAGRIIGLGRFELATGVPWWGWLGIGIALGGATVYVTHDQIKRRIG